MHTSDLIRDLGGRLRPVRPLAPPWRRALGWWLAAAAFAVGATALAGPMRPGFLTELAASPQLVTEVLAGVLLAGTAAYAACLLAVPGLGDGAFKRWSGVLLFLGWVGLVAYGFVRPALAPSTAGERPYCVFEVLAYALPPLVLLLALAGRGAPARGAWSGALAGLAAGAVPAAWMQLACMYEPAHALRFHLGPVALLALVGALAGRRFLSRL